MNRKEVREKISEIKEADILVGIPSYNSAPTRSQVVKTVFTGLLQYFPDMRAVIINSEGSSVDGTMEMVQKAVFEERHSLRLQPLAGSVFNMSTPYEGIQARATTLKVIFEIAEALRVKACAVIDSAPGTITPAWMETLLKPVLGEGFDYVLPLYQRRKYDGMMTSSIIYPVTRALYGQQVRQPLGADFAISGSLADFCLAKEAWETDIFKHGIDIWLPTTALANNFKVCQSFLGTKLRDSRSNRVDLSTTLYQVVGPIFALMEEYPSAWKPVKGSRPVATFGKQQETGLDPVAVNVERLIERFALGVRELITIWEIFLSKDSLDFLRRVAALKKDRFYIPDEIWAEIVYSFAIAFHRKILNNEHLLKSLTPLYSGKAASFVIETRDSNAAEIELRIEQLCETFEQDKLFLNINWR